MSQFSKTPSFRVTPTLSEDHAGIGELAIPILGLDGSGNDWASGTAVVVAPWLAMTARHVVEDYQDRFGVTRAATGLDHHFQLLTCLTLKGGRDVLPLFVGRVWYCDPIDIALLELQPASEFPIDYKWKVVPLSLQPPSVGDRVVAFGYAASRVTGPASGVGEREWKTSPSTSVGEVLEVHQQSRDSVTLPFPCFRTNARFDGGMSGGPVFDEAGHVCGIVCSNLPPTHEHEDHASYASSLWMAMGILVNANWDRVPVGTYYTVYELAQAGVLTVTGLENIQVIRTSAGSQSVALRRPLARSTDAL